MTIGESVLNALTRAAFHIACRLDHQELQNIPKDGPGLLLSNHVTNLEGPLYYVFLRPRKVSALGKQELWSHPVTRLYMKTWNIIPIHRGQVDGNAMRECRRVLREGYFLGIAAEGTRSRDGCLRAGQPGATFLATQQDVPIYPVVHWGLRELGTNLKKLRRTPVSVRVGRPFRLHKPDGTSITSGDRRRMTEEMMYQLALLLPEELRGSYRDLSALTTDYLQFLDE